MQALKFTVESNEEHKLVCELLERLGYDKRTYKVLKNQRFIFADNNGEIGFGLAKDFKMYHQLSDYKELTILELETMVLEYESKSK